MTNFLSVTFVLYTSENTKRVICTVLIGGLFNDYNKRSELVKFSHFTGTIEHRRSFNFDPFMSLLNAGVFKQTNKQVNYLASSFFVRKTVPATPLLTTSKYLMSGHLVINATLHKILIRSFPKVLLLPVFQAFFFFVFSFWVFQWELTTVK